MDQPTYSTESDFANKVLRLVNQSQKYITTMRSIKQIQSGAVSELENIKESVNTANVSAVSNIGIDLDQLDNELATLIKKFYVVQSSYKQDASLSTFLGDFKKNQQDAYAKLVSYSDGCIKQIDSVITAYSQIEKGITKADLWIKHILSHKSPPKIAKHAQESRDVINNLSKIVSHIRNTTHDAKLELLNIRNLSVKFSKPQKTEPAAF
jgi:3-dehydroquinate dehydratase